MKSLLRVLLAIALVLSMASPAAIAKPRLGFGVAVSTNGYFSTTLAEVVVESVHPHSPSEQAGLKVGDVIVELNGKPIKGASGLDVRNMLTSVKHGDHVLLKVLRGGEHHLLIDIVASP